MEQGQTLGSGLRNSVVWYYQAMARDIGEGRMEESIHKISYARYKWRDRSFWLSSSLKISPIEQVGFMENLYGENLPFDKDVMLKETAIHFTENRAGDKHWLVCCWFY
ncbi:penicillin-binding transpeptidase domain-containing protein [Peribacillus simplex]|uniref:penicillin-binding transpeptidase domain-containing protein n=1 Tax=Peribacillus simplex TaxID=1478 RepID=UPI00333DA1A0